ncbi:E3 ubiquitin-protein ligase Rnf220-like [Chrysoperla carnea]|uniref:E3 ubiquitin-protein ligase Rnf220-like n=1 Tax=Chrysoperla carnea TaxID=189513 RepID=UPI001D094817|nr:E3 ubiquitin-protein ligase Rnf220-like [Chrysoperla carnea]
MAMANLKELPSASTYMSNVSTDQTQQIATSHNVTLDTLHINFESQQTTSEEQGRGCRTKRKQTNPIFCPVCSVTIRPSELETHYLAELSKLDKLSTNKRKSSSTTMSTSPNLSTPSDLTTQSTTTETPNTENVPESIAPEKCWETYQSVKANRQSRLKLKSRKRKHDEIACPVCNDFISGDLNQHVEDCLRKSGNGDPDEDDVDVDVDDTDIDVGGDDFGEYEWAGQHRVRASSMLEGGYSACGIGNVSRKNSGDDEDGEDLIVDGDDGDKYGPAQYTERDIMLVSKGEDKDQTALRLAIIGSTNTILTETVNNKVENDDDDEEEPEETSSSSNEKVNKNPTIEALKQRVRELEKSESNKSQYKCLICMGRYKTPVISICCWHVHCELCWLKTLGIKKLCPQCNMITSPTDLRKVFI